MQVITATILETTRDACLLRNAATLLRKMDAEEPRSGHLVRQGRRLSQRMIGEVRRGLRPYPHPSDLTQSSALSDWAGYGNPATAGTASESIVFQPVPPQQWFGIRNAAAGPHTRADTLMPRSASIFAT